jgi:hypothetical protein
MMNKQETQNIAATLLSLGEERMVEVLNQLVANETFVQMLQSTLESSQAAKTRVEQGLEGLVMSLNLPTLDDVNQVQERLSEVEGMLDAIESRIGHIVDRLDEKAANGLSEEKSVPAASKRKKKKKAAKSKKEDS